MEKKMIAVATDADLISSSDTMGSDFDEFDGFESPGK
jgi:hypothetical protein